MESTSPDWAPCENISDASQFFAAAEPEDDAENLIGLTLGNYRLESKLGEGGMGQIYVARHLSIGKLVAIKVLRQEHAQNRDSVNRFFQEAKAVNEINHPHIIDVIDHGFSSGRHYLMMELLKGENLAQRIRSGGLSVDQALAVVRQCAAALSACHEHGIIHRDLKPENIFLVNKPRDRLFVKVLDFGIAKLTDPTLRVVATQGGEVLGTALYISPEQIKESATVDARTDIYSLGVVLYELLTGTVPFDGKHKWEVMGAHLDQPPRAPSAINPLLPPEIDAICLRALEKDAARRFHSMREFQRALANPERYVSEQFARDGSRPSHGGTSTRDTIPEQRATSGRSSTGRHNAKRTAVYAAMAMVVPAALGIALLRGRSAPPSSPAAASGAITAPTAAVGPPGVTTKAPALQPESPLSSTMVPKLPTPDPRGHRKAAPVPRRKDLADDDGPFINPFPESRLTRREVTHADH